MGKRESGRPLKKGEPVIRSLDEIIAAYEGQWVLMRVTRTELGMPAEGEVLAHSLSRKRVSKVLAAQPRRSELPPDAPQTSYYLFRAYPHIRSGEGWGEALKRAAEDPIWDKRLLW